MNYSYKRYYEPSTAEVLLTSLSTGTFFTALLYPIDFVKTRIQIRSEGIGIRQKNLQAGYNPFKVFRQIHASGVGMRGFFQGVDAALASRGGYLFCRNFLYKMIYDRVKPVKPTNDLTHREKGLLSGICGGIAALLCNPFELVMIRQIYDGTLPLNKRRNYQSVVDGISRIIAEEGGSQALMRGVFPTIIKAVLLNISLTGPYDYLNEKMNITFGDIGINRPMSLLYSSLIASLVTLPIDNIKTRMQKQFLNPDLNRITYTGINDCLDKILMYEGITSLYSGFYAYYARTALYCFMTVYTLDIYYNRQKKKAGLPEHKW